MSIAFRKRPTPDGALALAFGLIFAAIAASPEPLRAQVTEVVLHSFLAAPHGAHPSAGLVFDSAGNLYGTTTAGGPANYGVVYKFDPAGNQTVLYAFSGIDSGGVPMSGVAVDAAGNIYGTAGYPSENGDVYKVDPSGHGTVLYSFKGLADGGDPQGGVTLDASGNIYGTASRGGIDRNNVVNNGVVFKLDPAGNETVLYSFTGPDGSGAVAGVIFDSAGNLYGTAEGGGTGSEGVVYKLDPTNHETVLYSFTGGADGGQPLAGVTADAAGNLYGTASVGGTSNAGVVYKLDTSGHETVLYSFTGGADGGAPNSGLVLDSAGNLYGTTSEDGVLGFGVVYKIAATGEETVLHSFADSSDGGQPQGGVILDSTGNLYGTAFEGGTRLSGVLYQLDPGGDQTVLYDFRGGEDGEIPGAGLLRDSAGNLYSTTSDGGAYGGGTVFKLRPSGYEAILLDFGSSEAGGITPETGVVADAEGNLYGTTFKDGPGFGHGLVYKLDPSGHETVLHAFTGGADGAVPNNVILDSAGNLYGTTLEGGYGEGHGKQKGHGVVYKLDASGNETVLHTFADAVVDGSSPQSGLIRDAAGNLYGTCIGGGADFSGLVYKLDPAGVYTVLYTFSGGVDGGEPYSALTMDSAGNLYGTTVVGGTGNYGTVYKLDTSGHETVLYSFSGGVDGAYIGITGVVLDAAGNLYGTTQGGGTSNYGVVYKVDASGNETVLHSFTGGADGNFPNGVIVGSDGNLYGTTGYGGTANAGVVFELEGVAPAQ